MRYFIFLFLGFLVVPVEAFSQVTLGAHCDGDSVRIGITVFNNWVEDAPEEQGITVIARYVGTCEDPISVDHPAMVIPPYLSLATYSFAIPHIDFYRYFFYQAWGVDSGGNLYPVFGGGDVKSHDFAGCEDAVMARGTLTEDSGFHFIIPCPDSCWDTTYPECYVDFTDAAPGWEPFVDTGLILDFYGRAYTSGMPGAPCAFIDRVEPVTDPDGCGAVATKAMSWGSLKSTYR